MIPLRDALQTLSSSHPILVFKTSINFLVAEIEHSTRVKGGNDTTVRYTTKTQRSVMIMIYSFCIINTAHWLSILLGLEICLSIISHLSLQD